MKVIDVLKNAYRLAKEKIVCLHHKIKEGLITFFSWLLFTFLLSLWPIGIKLWELWREKDYTGFWVEEISKGDLLLACGISLGTVCGLLFINTTMPRLSKLLLGAACFTLVLCSLTGWYCMSSDPGLGGFNDIYIIFLLVGASLLAGSISSFCVGLQRNDGDQCY